MHRLTSKLIIYRGIGEDTILRCLAQICRRFYEGSYDKEAMISEIYEQVHSLLDLATKYGFNKNLWHNYLAYLIATTETPFTLVSEKVGANEGSVNAFALNDFRIFRELSENRSAYLTGASARKYRNSAPGSNQWKTVSVKETRRFKAEQFRVIPQA